MSDRAREVMYIGRKDRKADNVNHTGYVWNGLGDIQSVSVLEANTLTRHAAIWADVTDWPAEKRIQTVESVKERIRAEKRAHQPKVTLDVASVEDLENELQRRRHPLQAAKVASTSPVNVGVTKPTDHSNPDTGAAVERPASPAEVVQAIIGAVMMMDPGKKELFDDRDNPTLEAVIGVLGYKISKSELTHALKEINK